MGFTLFFTRLLVGLGSIVLRERRHLCVWVCVLVWDIISKVSIYDVSKYEVSNFRYIVSNTSFLLSVHWHRCIYFADGTERCFSTQRRIEYRYRIKLIYLPFIGIGSNSIITSFDIHHCGFSNVFFLTMFCPLSEMAVDRQKVCNIHFGGNIVWAGAGVNIVLFFALEACFALGTGKGEGRGQGEVRGGVGH